MWSLSRILKVVIAISKSSILVIILVFILSIIIVSYYGLSLRYYDVKIYAQKIELLHTGFKTITTNNEEKKYLRYKFTDEKFYDEEKQQFIFQIYWRVLPDNTTEKDVEFVYEKTKSGYTINNRGIVFATKKGSYPISIYTEDGSNIKETFLLVLGD